MSQISNITWQWRIEEYFRNPFVWWGFSIHIISFLGLYYPIVEGFRTILWVKQFNLVFFIPMMIWAILDTFIPFQTGMRQFSRIRQNMSTALLMVLLLGIALLMDLYPFPLEIITIMGDQNKQMLKNSLYFSQLEEYLTILSFVIPAILVYDKTVITNILRRNRILILDTIPEWVIPLVWMIFISFLIGFTIVIDP